MSAARELLPGVRRFPCTPGPETRAGRRRLAALLLALTAIVAGVAAFAWAQGRVWPALLALAVGALALFAWRMSGDLDPRELWLGQRDGRLTIRTRRHLIRRAVSGVRARPLSADEIDHLRLLTETGGFRTATGGFDSHRLGEFDLYATDLANGVILDFGDERIVVTPDDPAAFIAALSPEAARPSNPEPANPA